MTCIDRVERDSDRKTTPRTDRYLNSDAACSIHCKARIFSFSRSERGSFVWGRKPMDNG